MITNCKNWRDYFLRNTSKNKGFTLIELLCIIIILGVIALIAVPMVNTIITE